MTKVIKRGVKLYNFSLIYEERDIIWLLFMSLFFSLAYVQITPKHITGG